MLERVLQTTIRKAQYVLLAMTYDCQKKLLPLASIVVAAYFVPTPPSTTSLITCRCFLLLLQQQARIFSGWRQKN